MTKRALSTTLKHSATRIFLVLLGFAVVYSAASLSTYSQQRVSRRYPVRKNVRIELKNISGRIIVESWSRDEIMFSASLETPKANLSPRLVGEGGLVIDVLADNRGRGDVGDVNFKIQVPFNSSVDIETRRGDITITNIRGDLVRAHVSSEGDITLTGISSTQVLAQNMIGNIHFDGDFARGGNYQFRSTKGDISIRIPANSAFNLTAAAPTRQIELNEFWNKDVKSLGNGRKFVSEVMDGRPLVTVTNLQGSITFLRR